MVSLDDLRAMANASQVEGQVGAAFEFRLQPHHQEGLRILLARFEGS